MQAILNGIRLRQGPFDLLCRTHGLKTLEDIAEAVNVHHSTVSRIVRGDVAPSPKFMAGACLAFKVGIDDLFEVFSDEEAPEVAA